MVRTLFQRYTNTDFYNWMSAARDDSVQLESLKNPRVLSFGKRLNLSFLFSPSPSNYHWPIRKLRTLHRQNPFASSLLLAAFLSVSLAVLLGSFSSEINRVESILCGTHLYPGDIAAWDDFGGNLPPCVFPERERLNGDWAG